MTTKLVLAIPAESRSAETRVSATPDTISRLATLFTEIRLFKGAGAQSGYADESYIRAGATVVDSVADLYGGVDVALRVKRADDAIEAQEIPLWQRGMAVIGFLDPQITNPAHLLAYAKQQVVGYSMELLPQNQYTQPMDATAAMSRVSGEVVINEAASRLGSLEGKTVLVLGVGNAGLAAIHKARNLGAKVYAISTSERHKDELAALSVPLFTIPDERRSSQPEAEVLVNQQVQVMHHTAALTPDVIIGSARRVGQKAPMLLPQAAHIAIKPGCLVYDLTASSGGNCEGNVYGKDVRVGDFTICSKTGYPKAMPQVASPAYADCAAAFIQHLFISSSNTVIDNGILTTCVTAGGEINPVTKLPDTNADIFLRSAQTALERLRMAARYCR